MPWRSFSSEFIAADGKRETLKGGRTVSQIAHSRYLTTHFPHLSLIVESHTATDHPSYPVTLTQPGDEVMLRDHTDLVITLGGDGTILHTSNLFGGGECPPVLSFSMGSLGFLLPFRE